ncbi:MAG: ABC transporter ATP-binding protein [Desulfovibrio sp.]|nr:ABC transporter ATP-binding protein [Desulfovibrio sp.]
MLIFPECNVEQRSQKTTRLSQADDSPLLCLEHITQRFSVGGSLWSRKKTLTAVDDVSLTLARGESVGLVGESGCGKSTVGRIACGLLSPSQGRVVFDGRDLPPAGAKSWAVGRIQMIFQDPASSLNPRLCIRSSVAEALISKNMQCEKRKECADAILADVGLAGVGDRYPHEFSGGQRQRIAIARALITRPDVIICDEPVSALDASVQAQTLNLLRDAQTRLYLAYLFISHNLAVVGFFCRRILVMYLGQIVEEAPTEEIFTAAVHPFTQALLAAMPNFTRKNKADNVLRGELPSPLALPNACHFHPRCPKVKEICRKEAPPWREIGQRHYVRCWQLL